MTSLPQPSSCAGQAVEEYASIASDLPIQIPLDRIAELCARWRIAEMALFGSVLRPDFHESSDVDVLITLAPGVRYGFAIVQLRDELQEIIGRPIDLVTRRQMESGEPTRRSREILATARVLYRA